MPTHITCRGQGHVTPRKFLSRVYPLYPASCTVVFHIEKVDDTMFYIMEAASGLHESLGQERRLLMPTAGRVCGWGRAKCEMNHRTEYDDACRMGIQEKSGLDFVL